jgi:transposase
MQVLLTVCCGLDVHKETVTACLRKQGSRGKVAKETRTFRTTTAGLLELADWLTENGCQHVAMESTGVYWKPVYNILEGVCEQVLLVNAQHIKNVPGRKTDVKDADWISDLLAFGLLRGSFVPPQEIRDVRELTRYRKTLIQRRADECNRIQKLLEGCNIKLASVATDILGVSGWEMLEALAEGQTDPAKLADLAHGRLRRKIPQLTEALHGRVRETQRWLLREQLEHIRQLGQQIVKLNDKIEELMVPFAPLIEKLDKIPGVAPQTAQMILAEIGTDMSRFPSAQHLASWAGMCPGHHESAGKRQSGKTRKGSPWLRATLIEAGWAASHTKDTYLAAQHRNIARHRGKKRANLAVGHSILTIVYHLLSNPEAEYTDLGPNYFEQRSRDRLAQSLIRRLASLGVNVVVETSAA